MLSIALELRHGHGFARHSGPLPIYSMGRPPKPVQHDVQVHLQWPVWMTPFTRVSNRPPLHSARQTEPGLFWTLHQRAPGNVCDRARTLMRCVRGLYSQTTVHGYSHDILIKVGIP